MLPYLSTTNLSLRVQKVSNQRGPHYQPSSNPCPIAAIPVPFFFISILVKCSLMNLLHVWLLNVNAPDQPDKQNPTPTLFRYLDTRKLSILIVPFLLGLLDFGIHSVSCFPDCTNMQNRHLVAQLPSVPY